jgi:hypothetical protein
MLLKNINLITICGEWTDNFELKLKSLLNYIPFDMRECDVIIVSDREQKFELTKCIQVQVINDCENNKLFSYKCLDYANHEKDKIELNRDLMYDYCFFIDANDMKVNNDFPKKFIESYDRGIVTFDSKKYCRLLKTVGQPSLSDEKLKIKDARFKNYIILVSTSFWYCNSIEFSILSKFYKGKNHLANKDTWEHWTSNPRDGECPFDGKVYDEIVSFWSYIRRLGFNFIYAN